MARLGVVLRLQSTAGSSATQCALNLFNRLKILGLRPYRSMLFARSTCPFVRGCATVAQSTRMCCLSQNERNFLSVNCVPLSVMMEFETPKRWTMSVKNNTAYSDFITVIGQASIHFMNLSTAISKCVKPLGTLLRGPTRSSPQTMNDHVMGIV